MLWLSHIVAVAQLKSCPVGLVYRIAGNFCMVQIFVFLQHAGEHKSKNHKNFYERTLDGPSSLFQDLCGSPPCASFAAWRTCTLRKYKQQKDRGDHLRGFHLRRWRKATKPTGIAGPLSLAKKCLAWGNLATGSIFHWHSKAWSIAMSCLHENKNHKNFF